MGNRETEAHPLIEKVSAFPQMPGVYLMRAADSEVIYIGKAKKLRSRVRSYFNGQDDRLQVGFLMQRVADIEMIVTETENQAFILERDLIAKYKPRYNIRLKDDKTYLSIRLDRSVPWPRLELVRRREDDDAEYFGPYSFSHELRSLLDSVKRAVPLRSCADAVFYNRTRPCLEYQIKRCCGPCCLEVDRKQYEEYLDQAVALLQGKADWLVKDLTKKMEKASAELRFEDAATIRDRIETLQTTKTAHDLISLKGDDKDVFALYREETLAALAVLRVRGGRISESKNFLLQDLHVSDAEVLESGISQFYMGDREVPAEIVVPLEFENLSLVAEALTTRRGARVEIATAQRGVRYRLSQLAHVNAQQHFISSYGKEERYQSIAKALAKTAKLRQVPRRIECVDISNLQGSDIVGALVSFFDGEPDKARYRKYKMKGRDLPDDFASIFEVVSRRLERAKEEDTLPDLLIIDGGPGQLSKAIEARDALGIQLDIIALAKMRTMRDPYSPTVQSSNERIYIADAAEPIELDAQAELTKFLQRVRDEAHRFVITFHRTKRAGRVLRSVLDEIPGIGPERRQRLLRYFGSVAMIARADGAEVARVGRMPRSLADKLQRTLSSRQQGPKGSP
ncbi:MAG: excinuclease ABC subunit UvrC [Bdellovibrionota bacterium]|nr:MAG: excinuclease ABC subunit UvrC [Bdellovibrionota bacterium]